MEKKILQELQEIKKELQDIHSNLEFKTKNRYHPIVNKIIWAIKWFFPCIYHCEYISDGKHMVSIWRSWLWFDLWERCFEVASPDK